MTANFKKQVKQIFGEDSEVYADKIVCKATGEIEIKHGYFYRHGNTSEKWAAKVKAELEARGLDVEVTHRDDWRAWPKDSYFVAIVKEA